jgi:hypothetical protein
LGYSSASIRLFLLIIIIITVIINNTYNKHDNEDVLKSKSYRNTQILEMTHKKEITATMIILIIKGTQVYRPNRPVIYRTDIHYL